MAKVNYIFAAAEPIMRTAIGKLESGAIVIERGAAGVALYGQYIPVPAGTYRAVLRFKSEVPCIGAPVVDVCASSGRLLLNAVLVSDFEATGVATIEFTAPKPLSDLEVRLHARGDFAGAIESLTIEGDLLFEAPRVRIGDLPPVAIQNTISRNRNLFDGYQRGVGLQFAGLMEKVQLDPDYREARELAGARTIVGELNLCNIFLIMKFYLPRQAPGHIVEFGSYKGGGAIFMAALARKFLPGRKVLGFDTFAGMPPTDDRVDHHKVGAFSGVDLNELRQYVGRIGLTNLEFVQGDFGETAVPTLQKAGAISLCHIDCDIRSAIACAYDAAKPHMVAGGYWVFDDPMISDCLGAAEAMEDLLIKRDQLNSEQIYPHYVFRQPVTAARAAA